MLAATSSSAPAADPRRRAAITLTFVRHAQSQANADGVIDTERARPRPHRRGQGQAEQVAHQSGRNDFDGIYASAMAEAQQTAAPLASELGKQVEVLHGLQEIDAGWYNGKPESMADSTYMLAPADWLNGDVQDSIPGSISGKSSTTSSPPPSRRSTTAATTSRWCSRTARRSWCGR